MATAPNADATPGEPDEEARLAAGRRHYTLLWLPEHRDLCIRLLTSIEDSLAERVHRRIVHSDIVGSDILARPSMQEFVLLCMEDELRTADLVFGQVLYHRMNMEGTPGKKVRRSAERPLHMKYTRAHHRPFPPEDVYKAIGR